MTVSILRLLGVRPRERGEPGAQLRVGLGGPAPGQRAPRAVEQQCPSEPVVSGQQRGAPPRLERDLAGRSDVRYVDVTQHFVEPLDGFLNRSTVHPRTRGEAARGRRSIRRVRGPSPRARGGPVHGLDPFNRPGTIPARAGRTAASIRPPKMGWFYPRACAAAQRTPILGTCALGLPPRGAGRPSRVLVASVQRCIPARAGSRDKVRIASRTLRVHPEHVGRTPRAGRALFALVAVVVPCPARVSFGRGRSCSWWRRFHRWVATWLHGL